MKHDSIAVIDFGGQYAHLIATKVRRQGVFAEIRQPEEPTSNFEKYKGIIISGSPSLASMGEGSDYNKEIFDLKVPILGFCFGHQEIARHYGGEVIHGGREWGFANLHVMGGSPIFKGLGPVEQVWMSHFDSVVGIGPDFEELGYSTYGESGAEHRFAAIGSDRLKRYGFQFHPEVDDTLNGDRMIGNFAVDICGCKTTWNMDGYLDEQVEKIRKRVGDKTVFLLASGGVDSTVAAKLFGMSIGPDQLHLLHVDNGLMRKDESRRVIEMFKEMGLDKNLHFADASDRFLAALKGVIEPEKKRKAIGDTFVEVFEAEAKRLGIERCLLGQGTIYPDTIETGGTKRADTIKTHHNRVPVISRMIEKGLVIEPLADLYKVEVRELGERLGLPDEALHRHPFPGPGLGVRLLCSSGKDDLGDIDSLNDGVKGLAGRYGLDGTVLPIRSVGVKADLRSYERPVMLSGDATWEKLFEAASVIAGEVQGVNRCVWNLLKPPKSARPLAASMTRDRLDLLREADNIVMQGLARHGVLREIWQCPTVLVPLEIDGKGKELVIVRPVLSERAMTAAAAPLPAGLIDELRESLNALPGVSGVAIDVTSKPPGTIEWE